MTVVPLPDVPCVRVRLIYNEGQPGEMGNRFYLSYSGSAPTGANCTSLATAIESNWSAHMAAVTPTAWTLDEIDVLDIATDSGLSGQWTGTANGSRGSGEVPANCATNLEFGIARRYRGGKPRIFLPPGLQSDQASQVAWNSTFTSAVASAWAAFMAANVAESIGSMGTLVHVNLSYYKGFTNIENSSGRMRAVPTYKTTATHDDITGYFVKSIVGSQRRRRTSTSP